MNPEYPYLEHVKKTLISSYFQLFINEMPANQLVKSLNRILTFKEKSIKRIAIYVEKEVNRGKPLNQVLSNIAFFALVFQNHIDEVNNQPMLK